MKDFLIGLILAAALAFCTGYDSQPPSDSKYVVETYVVRSGDTLWGIADTFMKKNTYGPRDIREFYHGIVEYNYDDVFKNRADKNIHPGDVLQIPYWTKETP